MARHILFFIHGMGVHDESWHSGGLKVLKSEFQQYELLKRLDFDDQFLIVPIVYDDIFSEARERANEDFSAFKTAILGGFSDSETTSRSAVENQIETYAQFIGTEDEFVWTHILDVLLYRFARTLSMPIEIQVARKIVDTLSENSFRSWSVIAHSLGTSVIHNTLNSLYKTGFDGVDPLNPIELQCNSLVMVANVSRVLQRPTAKVFTSRVKPGSPSAGRLCSYYLNVRHKLDLLTAPKPFNPDLWPDPGTFSTERYQHIRPSHINFGADNVAQVHALDHYLEDPRVHVPIFRSIYGRSIVGPEEYRSAKAKFDSEVNADNRDGVRALLENKLPASTGNWRNVLIAIKTLLTMK